MCGIFGYIGNGMPAKTLVEGLARLEYRGYDSCGIAGLFAGAKTPPIFLKKRSGKITALKEELIQKGNPRFSACILHTRWATHGKPNKNNAHPHMGVSGAVAIVHNGIIENHLVLKEELSRKGYRFKSQTDSEVIVHLIEEYYVKSGSRKRVSLKEAVAKAVNRLKGSFALAVVSRYEPDTILGVRTGSPLIVGAGDTAQYLASDIPALLPFTRKVIYLKDGEIAILRPRSVHIMNFQRLPAKIKIEKVKINPEDAGKKGYEHFMLKEIFEQPEVLKKTASLYAPAGKVVLPDIRFQEAYLKNIKNVFITACGTAYHAGYVGKYFLEKYCGVDVEIDTSSEFRYRTLNLKRGDLLIAISQSGETADTLAAVRAERKKGVKVLSICNVLGSSLVKESDSLIYTLAGPEIGVASTKAYTAQLFSLYLFSLYLGRLKKTMPSSVYARILQDLVRVPRYQKEILAHQGTVKKCARKFSKFGCFLFLGRGINYPTALEGALKLKEISYIPAEGYAAGEMKHGPIALIDEYRGVVCIALKDELYPKMVSNIQEIKARKGKVLSVVNDAEKEASSLSDEIIIVPRPKCTDINPLLAALPLQLFAYYVAKNLGCEIDQPRNLAKSVTVE